MCFTFRKMGRSLLSLRRLVSFGARSATQSCLEATVLEGDFKSLKESRTGKVFFAKPQQTNNAGKTWKCFSLRAYRVKWLIILEKILWRSFFFQVAFFSLVPAAQGLREEEIHGQRRE